MLISGRQLETELNTEVARIVSWPWLMLMQFARHNLVVQQNMNNVSDSWNQETITTTFWQRMNHEPCG